MYKLHRKGAGNMISEKGPIAAMKQAVLSALENIQITGL